jgi:hypothetical protein
VTEKLRSAATQGWGLTLVAVLLVAALFAVIWRASLSESQRHPEPSAFMRWFDSAPGHHSDHVSCGSCVGFALQAAPHRARRPAVTLYHPWRAPGGTAQLDS